MYLAHLEKLARTRLADVLVEEGVLERPRVDDALAEQDRTGKQLGEILIEREILTEQELAKLVATHYAMPYLDISNYSTRREMLELLPAEFCAQHTIVPLDQFGSMLTLAVSEVPSLEIVDEIVERTKLTPILFVSQRRALIHVIEEEKKRASRRDSRAPGKAALLTAPIPAAAAPSAPAPSVAAPVPAPVKQDLELPEFDLPTVSMKLVGGVSRTSATPARTTAVRESATSARPATAAAAALSWMDAIGAPGPRTADPPRPKISKFGTGAATHGPAGKAPPSSGRPGGATSPNRPEMSPVRHVTSTGGPVAGPARAAPPAAEESPSQPGATGWQSVFDAADAAVKKPKN